MPNLVSPNDIDIYSFLDDYFYFHLLFSIVAETKLIEIEAGFQILEARDNDYLYIKLMDNKGQNLSVLRLQEKNYDGNNYYLINKSYSFVQQKGYGSTLYEYCFCYLELPVISDKTQTKAGSSNLWNRLHRKVKKNYEILIYNERNGKYKRLNSKVTDYSVWGVAIEFIEIYKETKYYSFDSSGIEDDYDFYDPNTIFGTEYIHKQLEEYIKKGLATRRNKKSIKQKINDRSHLRLIGKKLI